VNSRAVSPALHARQHGTSRDPPRYTMLPGAAPTGHRTLAERIEGGREAVALRRAGPYELRAAQPMTTLGLQDAAERFRIRAKPALRCLATEYSRSIHQAENMLSCRPVLAIALAASPSPTVWRCGGWFIETVISGRKAERNCQGTAPNAAAPAANTPAARRRSAAAVPARW